MPKYCSMTGLYHTGSAATRTLYNIIYIVHQLDLSLPLEKLWRPQRLQGTIRPLSTLLVLYTQYQVSSHMTHDKISHTFLSSVICKLPWKWSNTGGTRYILDCWVNSHSVCTCTMRACKDKEWEISAHKNYPSLGKREQMWKSGCLFLGFAEKSPRLAPL